MLASSIIHFKKNLDLKQWLLSILGSLVVIISWVLDYWNFSNQLEADLALSTADQYVPGSFNWYIFLIGIVLLLLAVASHYVSNRKFQKSHTNDGN